MNLSPRHWIAPLLLFAAACTGAPDPLEVDGPMARQASSPVSWARARPAAGGALLEAPGTVVRPAQADAHLAPPVATRVERVHVQVGDRVEAGAPLVDVTMPEVVQAAGRLVAADIRIASQRKLSEQLEGLREHGLVRGTELAEAQAALAEARADRMAALSVLAGAGLSAADAGPLLSNGGGTTLRSPIAGVVLGVDAPLGAIREPGGEPLVRVGAPSSGRVVARIAGALPPGAVFEWVQGPATPVPLTLVSESPFLGSQDGNREIFLQAEATLSPGASGRVRIRLPAEVEALTIPTRAIFLRDGASLVFVRAGHEVREVGVQVLSTTGSEALVLGLEADQRVAADATRYAAQQEALGASE